MPVAPRPQWQPPLILLEASDVVHPRAPVKPLVQPPASPVRPRRAISDSRHEADRSADQPEARAPSMPAAMEAGRPGAAPPSSSGVPSRSPAAEQVPQPVPPFVPPAQVETFVMPRRPHTEQAPTPRPAQPAAPPSMADQSDLSAALPTPADDATIFRAVRPSPPRPPAVPPASSRQAPREEMRVHTAAPPTPSSRGSGTENGEAGETSISPRRAEALPYPACRPM